MVKKEKDGIIGVTVLLINILFSQITSHSQVYKYSKGLMLVLFPGPAQLSVSYSMEKKERAYHVSDVEKRW